MGRYDVHFPSRDGRPMVAIGRGDTGKAKIMRVEDGVATISYRSHGLRCIQRVPVAELGLDEPEPEPA